MNTFGNIYRLTSFGESHGPGIGGVIDGCPAGIELDTAFIQSELNRRKPRQSKITTPRKEDDAAEAMWLYYKDNKAKLISDIKEYRAGILAQLMAGLAVEEVFAPYLKPVEPTR